MFDTNAGCLPPHQFLTFILPYLAALPPLVAAHLKPLGIPVPPMTVFSKGTNSPAQLLALAKIGYSTVGIDWTISPREARVATQGLVSLQGNMDPAVLHGGRPVGGAVLEGPAAHAGPAAAARPRAAGRPAGRLRPPGGSRRRT